VTKITDIPDRAGYSLKDVLFHRFRSLGGPRYWTLIPWPSYGYALTHLSGFLDNQYGCYSPYLVSSEDRTWFSKLHAFYAQFIARTSTVLHHSETRLSTMSEREYEQLQAYLCGYGVRSWSMVNLYVRGEVLRTE